MADVVWVSMLMSRLSDSQWHDAFRAAGYSGDHARRFVATITSKVAEGLKLAGGQRKLPTPTSTTPDWELAFWESGVVL